MHPELEEVVRELESATERVHRLAQGLSPEAWRQRPTPERWSPGECVAHLNLTSVAMLPRMQQALDEARRTGRPARARYRRDPIGWLLWWTISRPGRFKTKTAAAFVPSGDRPAREVIGEFERLQAAAISLAREADGQPIDRVRIASPFDARARYNLFSAFSILARHQHRHLWQAESDRSL